MGLSSPRWWCELKGGPAERRRQVENQGKTRRAGWREEGKGGKEAEGVFHRQVFLVYRQQDRLELLRLQKMDLQSHRTWNCVYDSKNSPTMQNRAACLDITFATEFNVITSWDL